MEPLLPHLLAMTPAVVGDFADHYRRQFYNGESFECEYGKHTYLQFDGKLAEGGVETDDSKLRPITVGIYNWERQYYIPYIVDMYYHQDYPKELLEIIVADSDSFDKEGILAMMKNLAKKYPEIKFRFFQYYENPYDNCCFSWNTGPRHASNELVIMNASDSIPLGTNFLRGVCYTHNLRSKLYFMPVPVMLGNNVQDNPWNIGARAAFDLPPNQHWRHGHDYVTSMERSFLHELRGLDQCDAHGGYEGNLIGRILWAGGLIHPNTAVCSAEMVNFPGERPVTCHQRPLDKQTVSFATTIQANDEDWGTLKNMKELYLYD